MTGGGIAQGDGTAPGGGCGDEKSRFQLLRERDDFPAFKGEDFLSKKIVVFSFFDFLNGGAKGSPKSEPSMHDWIRIRSLRFSFLDMFGHVQC